MVCCVFNTTQKYPNADPYFQHASKTHSCTLHPSPAPPCPFLSLPPSLPVSLLLTGSITTYTALLTLVSPPIQASLVPRWDTLQKTPLNISLIASPQNHTLHCTIKHWLIDSHHRICTCSSLHLYYYKFRGKVFLVYSCFFCLL